METEQALDEKSKAALKKCRFSEILRESFDGVPVPNLVTDRNCTKPWVSAVVAFVH